MAEDSQNGWGLAANGCSGNAEIHVDSRFISESDSDSELWQLEIHLPNFYLRFAIQGPGLVSDLITFLQCHMDQEEFHETQLGNLGDCTVSLLKCDECAGHFIFLVSSNTGAVRFDIFSKEARDFVAALEDASADLVRSGEDLP